MMTIVRVIVLAFLTFYTFSMGQIPSTQLNGFGKLAAMLFFFLAPMLYFLPTYEAFKRDQPNLSSIGVLNLFLGWTVVGWVIALAWAVKDGKEKAPKQNATKEDAAPQNQMTKKCPFCAEEVLEAAIKCKHCGSDLSGPPTAATDQRHLTQV